MTRPEFERVVEQALAGLPKRFRRLLVNVTIDVRDTPGPEARGHSRNLLGLYAGPRRHDIVHLAHSGLPPGRIVLYQRNLEDDCATVEELKEQIARTLLHEIAHYLGIGEERLHQVWPEGA